MEGNSLVRIYLVLRGLFMDLKLFLLILWKSERVKDPFSDSYPSSGRYSLCSSKTSFFISWNRSFQRVRNMVLNIGEDSKSNFRLSPGVYLLFIWHFICHLLKILKPYRNCLSSWWKFSFLPLAWTWLHKVGTYSRFFQGFNDFLSYCSNLLVAYT